MSAHINPAEEQVDTVLNTCMEREDEGYTAWPGLTYEQGVSAALRWVMGEGGNPLED